jgi:hypothetical protein
MRWAKRSNKCDAMDIAAIWPCSGQSGFFAIPEIEARDGEQRNHFVDKKKA